MQRSVTWMFTRGLGETEAENILLEIFPKSLERNRIKTTTFFATYFSDAGGESDAKASFYPRLFDGLLREMNEIEAFSGLSTPFRLEETIAELSRRSQIAADKVREAVGRMKQLGIFEDRPGHPGSWRTGRLYKSGLNMKYVRA